MWSDLRTLFWLQFKLTRAIFRGRWMGDRLRALGLLARLVSFVFSLPVFVLMGAALAIGLILLPPRAAYELAMLVNVGVLFFWLLLPASYNSQTIERFEMSRLFAYPVRFRSIVVGSVLISLLTMTGLWTVASPRVDARYAAHFSSSASMPVMHLPASIVTPFVNI